MTKVTKAQLEEMKKDAHNLLVGPIETGSTAEKEIAKHPLVLGGRECFAYVVIWYPKPKRFAPGRAQYESISGSFKALLK